MSKSSPSVDRVVAILDHLAARHGEPLTFSDIARDLGLSKATTHSVLLSLTEAGYIIRDPRTMRYQLGAALIRIGDAAAQVQARAAEFAGQEMQRLADLFELQSAAFALIDDEIVIVSTVGSPRYTTNIRRVGQRVPFVPPFGTMFLAWAGETVREKWFRSRDIADGEQRDRLTSVLDTIRSNGYGVWLTQEALSTFRSAPRGRAGRQGASAEDLLAGMDVGTFVLLPEQLGAGVEEGSVFEVDNIAAPVFDWRSEVAIMIALVGFDRAVPAHRVAEMAQETMKAAERATEIIGGVRPSDVAGSPAA